MDGLDSHAELPADWALQRERWALQSMGASKIGASDNHLAKELATC